MDLGVFYEVIVPLMEVEGTATICISTPLDEFNFYSELTDLKDDKGRHVFNVKHIGGNVAVPWKSAEGRSRVQAIYGTRSTLFKREIMGEIVGDNENKAFKPEKLKRWFEKAQLVGPYDMIENTIFIALDPNGGASGAGGPGSNTAIVSFIVISGRVVIVGMDNHPTTDPEQPRFMLYKHIDALLAQRCFAQCRLMFIPEANLGDQAQLLSGVLLRRSLIGQCNAEIMCQFPNYYGVFTYPGDPERYVMRAREKLAEDGFFFHRDWVAANPYSLLSPEALRAETMQTFQRQLHNFRATYIVPKSVQGRVRLVYTGKGDKDGKRTSGAKDDMAMALLLGYYYFTQYMSPYAVVSTRDSRSMFQINSGVAINKEKRPAL